MASGHPLNDEDRAGWLATIAQLMRDEMALGESVIVACSALKAKYRQMLFAPAASHTASSVQTAEAAPTPAAVDPRRCPRLFLVHLDGSSALLSARMAARKGHFMKPDMLTSQLATLEPPTQEECAAMGVQFMRIILDEGNSIEQEGRKIADFVQQQQLQATPQ
jgi:gluconokinase